MRGTTVEITTELITETCCVSTCGILFAVPATWQNERQRDHTSWYCPNGHGQSYTAKTNEEQLRDQLAEARRTADFHRSRGDRLEDKNTNLTRSNRALKGVATKLKKRVAVGTCPFCDHQFPDLASHVEAEHPAELADAIAEDQANDSRTEPSS